jgi:peroxiredoxin
MGEPKEEKARKPAKAPERETPAWSIIVQILFVGLAAVAVYAFVSTGREGEARRRCAPTCLMKPDYAGYAKKAPDFALPDMKGKTVHLSDFKGKVVVMNFWTKTCGPCMEEMPDIAELAKIEKAHDDVAVVTVSIDDGPDDVRDTLKALLREDPPFPILFDPDDKTVREVYGTRLFPETWIIDKEGVIRARFDGAREWNSSAAVELVEQIRSGGYCPLDVKQGHAQGEGSRLCESLTGG